MIEVSEYHDIKIEKQKNQFNQNPDVCENQYN